MKSPVNFFSLRLCAVRFSFAEVGFPSSFPQAVELGQCPKKQAAVCDGGGGEACFLQGIPAQYSKFQSGLNKVSISFLIETEDAVVVGPWRTGETPLAGLMRCFQ